MNPFDWPGPEFLLFYVLFASTLLFAQWWRKRLREEEQGEAFDLGDAYLMAYLNGRELALGRAVIASLLSRHLLEEDASGRLVACSLPKAVEPPVEKAALDAFRNPQKLSESLTRLCEHFGFQGAALEFKKKVERCGLLPDVEMVRARSRDLAWCVGLLFSVALIKVVLAMTRGHKNYWLLVFMCVTACGGALFVWRGRYTRTGAKTLADVRHLYAEMPGRIQSSPGVALMSPQEMAITAGLFGLGVLGASQVEGASMYQGMTRDPILRKAGWAGGTGCGGGCSSSDSSTSSDSSSSSSDSSSSCSSGSSSCSSGSSCSSSSCGGCSSS